MRLFPFSFVGYGKFLSSAGPAAGNHGSSVWCRHALPETMFVGALATARLIGPFHDLNFLRTAKVGKKLKQN